MAYRGKLLFLLAMLTAGAGWALEPDAHTLFLCRFDGDAVADFSVGSPHPQGVVGLTDGKRGQALTVPLGLLPFADSVAPITTGVQYASAGNTNLQQGTIEMWVRLLSPVLETTDKSPKLRYLFSSGKYTGALHGCAIVLSHFDGKVGEPYGLIFSRQNGSAKEKTWAVSCQPNWRPGEWHHVAVTYSTQEDALYVDGKRVATTKTGEAMDLIGDNFALGASIYHSYLSDCVIDEVRISDHVRYTADFTPE